MSVRSFAAVLLGLALSTTIAHAQDAPSSSRYRLQHAKVEPAPQHGTRFALRARLTPARTDDERREGGNFVLTGSLAKASGCGPVGSAIFANGFEN
jgi:hypothetical protein